MNPQSREGLTDPFPMARVGRIWLPLTCHNVTTSVKRARGTRECVGFCGERCQPVGGTAAENRNPKW